MDKDITSSSAIKYADGVNVGPITIGKSTAGTLNGPVYYMGINQTPFVISDSASFQALNGINFTKNLNDFSLFVNGPPIGGSTTLSLSMNDLYVTMSDAYDQNADLSRGTAITFQVMDVVGNGQIGKMIVFGSSLYPLARGTQGGSVGN